MRTFVLLLSVIALGLLQQLCLISGAGAAVSDGKIMENLLPAVKQESMPQEQPLQGVLFDVWQKQDTQQSAMGVYYYDFKNQEAISVLPQGYALQDVSPDQTWMLANKDENLWLVSLDDSTTELISNSFIPAEDEHGALFFSGDSFFYIQQQNEKTALLRHNINTAEEESRLDENMRPSGLLPGWKNSIWVRLHNCGQDPDCTADDELWMVDEKAEDKLAVNAEQFWPSDSNDQIAYANPSINTDLVFFADTLGFSSQQLRLAGSYTLDASWHPAGRIIAVLRLKRDFDTHEIKGIGQHLIDTRTLSVSEYASLDGLLGQALWRDDNTLLVIYTQEKTGTFQLAMAETHIQDGSVVQLSFEPAIQNDQLIYVRHIIGMTE